ncbi:MAG: hypothetical protein ABSB94_16120 [Syntrophorhabdales bacterium]
MSLAVLIIIWLLLQVPLGTALGNVIERGCGMKAWAAMNRETGHIVLWTVTDICRKRDMRRHLFDSLYVNVPTFGGISDLIDSFMIEKRGPLYGIGGGTG